jgi:hypothetical protein
MRVALGRGSGVTCILFILFCEGFYCLPLLREKDYNGVILVEVASRRTPKKHFSLNYRD